MVLVSLIINSPSAETSLFSKSLCQGCFDLNLFLVSLVIGSGFESLSDMLVVFFLHRDIYDY